MKLGLCLSGGGIKGIAHIGAIKAMEEENIEFDSISGTSSGSIIATLLACGYSANQMHSLFKNYAKTISYIDLKNIFKLIFGIIFKQKLIIDGLNSGIKIEKIINEACSYKGVKNISQISKELLIPAVNAQNGKVYIFNSCKINKETELEKYIDRVSIGRAVRASCTYPLVFSPCPYFKTDSGKKYEEKCKSLKCIISRLKKECNCEKEDLLDGGIKENLPWKELKTVNCDKIISINFSTDKKVKCCNNLIDIGVRSFDLINEELTRHELERIDFLHTIELLDVSLLDTSKIDEIYREGYLQTRRKISIIKKYLNK